MNSKTVTNLNKNTTVIKNQKPLNGSKIIANNNRTNVS